LLGPLELSRGGDVLKLPASRKVRALLGYLVLASRPVARTQICELLWDIPNDPRGELRWCLSKIRGLLDQDGRKRVIADGTSIRLDLTDCVVDTLEVTRAPEHGIQKLGVDRRRELAGLFKGELLEGLEIARSPMFDAWITAERRRFRGIQTVLLEHLSRDLPGPGTTSFTRQQSPLGLGHAVWCARELVASTERQARDPIERLTALQRAHQFPEGDVTLAAHDDVHTGGGVFVGLGREACVVTSHHDSCRRSQGANEGNDLARGPALEGHHREPDEIGLQGRDEPGDGVPHRALHQDQIGDRNRVVRIDVARERGERTVREAHRQGWRVLERVGHREQQNPHGSARRWVIRRL